MNPARGLCYRSPDGEIIEVLAVATHRIPEDEGDTRQRFVVFRHARLRDTWCLTLREWLATDWKEIARGEIDPSGRDFYRMSDWVLVGDPSTRFSDGVEVRRAWGLVEEGGRVVRATVKIGKRSREVAVLDGKVHSYREDARRAKKAWCREHNVTHVGAAAHYGHDGDQ